MNVTRAALLTQAALVCTMQWKPISEAPLNTEILVAEWIGDRWHRRVDEQCAPGEWLISDDDGPTLWQELAPAPEKNHE